MQFRFSHEDEAFRSEVKTFLRENWGDEPDDDSDEGMAAIQRRKAFEKKMAEQGLLTMHWPKEYGGRDASKIQQLIMREEMANAGAMYLDAQGVGMIGRTSPTGTSFGARASASLTPAPI